ncbi:hypothetical protein Aduo_013835 [Ancylostoma duodenale]
MLTPRSPKLIPKAVPRQTSCLNQEGECRPMRTCNTKETRQLAVTADEGGHLVQLPKLRCLSPPVGGASQHRGVSATVVVLRYCVGQSPRGVWAGRSPARRPPRPGGDVAARLCETTKRVRDERLKALGR